MRNTDIMSAAYKPGTLNHLKADFLAAAVEATNGGRESLAATYTLGKRYAELFPSVKPADSAEAAAEYLALVVDVLELGAGKYEISQRGTQMWVSDGWYTRGGERIQYKRATYRTRQELKALGFCWSAKNTAWYYNREIAHKKAAAKAAA